MGSTYSVYDTDSIGGWIDDELDFLRAADAADVPILGICFGAQAMAAAFGGRVLRSDQKQVGWHQFTADIECGIPDGLYMQWHYDRFDPPTDATVLGRDHVGVQAFTMGRHLATQFHPEVDRAHLEGWLVGGGDDELRKLGIDPDELLAETSVIEPEVTVRTNALVDWYLSDIAKL
jgi:GMP synthase-like glutamine amidotransferase